ncbi:MAG: hypothetical protein BM485_05870 [Desulfobulbaceae bacterium DB1]|nr:MAG: hypothetical protein BM485_05870 [Desulfobulbaceae bacterium DB1]
MTTNERDVRMLRNDQLGLKDITRSLDVDNDWVCGGTTSFTSFAAGEPFNSAGADPDLIPVPSGANVAVTIPLASAEMSFAAVDDGGCTMSAFVMSKPVPPPDYRLLGDRALDIDLECSDDGHICLAYDEADVIGAEADLVLWHRGVSGWEDITDSIDPVNNVICGFAASFSPFAVGELSDYTGLHLIPYPSALSSQEFDRVVEFNASRSSCYEEAYDHLGIVYPVNLNCTFTWDFGGPGTVIGGNGNDTIEFEYDDFGSYTATVIMTEDISGLTVSDTVTAEAAKVEPPPRSMDFSVSVNGNQLTLSAASIPTDIARIYVYWGDRKQTTIADSPGTILANGVVHRYLRGGGYNIRVVTIDAAYNSLEYTFAEDSDLAVILP